MIIRTFLMTVLLAVGLAAFSSGANAKTPPVAAVEAGLGLAGHGAVKMDGVLTKVADVSVHIGRHPHRYKRRYYRKHWKHRHHRRYRGAYYYRYRDWDDDDWDDDEWDDWDDDDDDDDDWDDWDD